MDFPEGREVSRRQGSGAGSPAVDTELNAAIVDAVADPIVTVDHRHRVIAMNAAAEATFGWERDEAEGRELVELIIPADTRTRQRRTLEDVLEEADEASGSRTTRVIAARRDGRRLPVEIGATRLGAQWPARIACFIRETMLPASGLAAERDPLTGLATRAALEHQLEAAFARARRRGVAVALIHIDLEGFRLVNRSLGYDAANELLRCVAERLVRVARTSDVVARHSADEFLILLPDLDVGDPQTADGSGRLAVAAETVAQRVHASLARPFTVHGTELFIQARAGISIFPFDASEPRTLLQHADAAHYQAKEPGSAPTRVFAAGAEAVEQRLEMITRLRKAVDRREFVLHYQPVIDLECAQEAIQAGRERVPMVGVEALIRWQDPDRGMVPPLDFIPLAEETGLIEPIGDWVVEQATLQAAAWAAEGIELDVAFNVSLRQLWQPDFVDKTVRATRLAGVDPRRMIVEITESTVMADPARTQGVLEALNEHGFRMAIDDFGTGHSSLARLWRMPVDLLKIDRSFVKEMPEDEVAGTMASTIIHLASNLGIDHLAEGIERADQLDYLVDQGAGLGQGFLFGRPVPALEITQLAA
jgi:diguanylate cyclase (GGDEF)-like protein/PAS domain S-box-containing protein